MGYEPVGAVGNLSGRFPAGAPITEDIPVGMILTNVHRARSFVIAVIPFREVRFDCYTPVQSSQRASPPCPPTRAAEHLREGGAPQSFSELSRFLFAMFGQRNICATGMLMR